MFGFGQFARRIVDPCPTMLFSLISMTPQRLSIQRVALSAAVWPEFQCQIVAPNLTPRLGVRVDQEG